MKLNLECPICGGNNVKDVNKKIETSNCTYKLFNCKKCKSGFWMPRKSPIEEFYDYEKPSFRWEYEVTAELIKKNKITGKVLDVGCGDGAFVKYLLDNAIEAEGIDFNKKNIKKAFEQGLPCYCKQLNDMPYNDKIKVITAFHFIEHIPYPAEIIKEMIMRLADNGLLLLSIPNTNRYHLHYMRDEPDYPPNHLSRITNLGLHLLMEKINCKITIYLIEKYESNWRKDTSLTANQLLEFTGLRNKINSIAIVKYFIKSIMFVIVQPWVIYWRSSMCEKQGYTALYCIEKCKS